MRTIIKLLPLLGIALLAGCGGSSSSNPNQVSTSKATAAAKAINLRQSDLPGWSASSSGQQSIGTSDVLAKCAGTSPASAALANESSPTFSQGAALAQQQISSSVKVMKSAQTVTSDLAAIQLPQASECIKKLLPQVVNSAAAGAATFGTPTITGLFIPIPNASGTFGYRITIVASAAGQKIPVTIDFLGAASGRNEISLNDFWLGPPISQATEQRLLEAMVARAANLSPA